MKQMMTNFKQLQEEKDKHERKMKKQSSPEPEDQLSKTQRSLRQRKSKIRRVSLQDLTQGSFFEGGG